MNEDEISNFQVFRDCLATPLVEKSAVKPAKKSRKSRAKGDRKTQIKPTAAVESNDAEELAEFIDYIATEIFTGLPPTLRTLTYSTWFNSPALQALYPDPLPKVTATSILNPLDPSIADSLTAYNFLPPDTSLAEFLTPSLTNYFSLTTTAPPSPSMTKNLTAACEICDRTWIPLTYHHLIPREVHGKVLKRGWHTEDQLNNVAWICRACHTFVHKIATNEELARDLYTVDRLLERQDMVDFARWVGKMRWKGR